MRQEIEDAWVSQQFVAKPVVEGSKSTVYRGKEEAQGSMPFGEGNWILLYM